MLLYQQNEIVCYKPPSNIKIFAIHKIDKSYSNSYKTFPFFLFALYYAITVSKNDPQRNVRVAVFI